MTFSEICSLQCVSEKNVFFRAAWNASAD